MCSKIRDAYAAPLTEQYFRITRVVFCHVAVSLGASLSEKGTSLSVIAGAFIK